jgi:tRNA pseudouridine38-40 synthase
VGARARRARARGSVAAVAGVNADGPAGRCLRRHGLPRVAGPARRANGADGGRGGSDRGAERAGDRLAGAGRTDAGVHARGQVASFETTRRCPPGRSRRSRTDGCPTTSASSPRRTRARLPRPPLARARAGTRTGCSGARTSARRATPGARRAIDVDRLERATRGLEGEADFSAFQSGQLPVSPRCRVHRARWRALRGGARLDIVADHFLYHMVRNIVGTALDAARAPDPEAAMRDGARSRDRSARASRRRPPGPLPRARVLRDGGVR